MFSDLFVCQSVFPTLSHNIQGKGEGVPCDLSHNALDVTCLLSRHQLTGVAWCSCLYTAAHASWERSHGPPSPWILWDRVGKTDWQTNRSENITFPQTTHVGSNKETEIWNFSCLWKIAIRRLFSLKTWNQSAAGNVWTYWKLHV